MKHLFIKLLTVPEKDQEQDFYDVALEWAIKDSGNELIGQGNADHRALMDLTGLNNNWNIDFEITVVLPNSWATATALMVPGKNASQIERALPFAAEEFISSEVEEIHIARGKIKSGELLTCHLIDSVIMRKILSLLNSSNILPTRMILESELIPHPKYAVSLFNSNEKIVIKTDHHAIEVHRDNLTKAINSLENDFDRINLLNGELTDLEISELIEPVIFTDNLEPYDNSWSSLLAGFKSKDCIDLLQGQFKQERANGPTNIELVSLFEVALIAFATISVFYIAEGVWSQVRANDYEEKAFSTYQSIFSTESAPITINALLRRVNTKLNRETDNIPDHTFLDRLDAVSKSLPESSSLLTMSYSGETQELVLIVLLKNYDTLDEFKNSLAKQRLNMVTSSAEEQGSLVRARIRIGPDR